jgi:hypothetical protein
MDVIMNPPILKSNKTLKSSKRNRHFDADKAKDNGNSFSRKSKGDQKESI